MTMTFKSVNMKTTSFILAFGVLAVLSTQGLAQEDAAVPVADPATVVTSDMPPQPTPVAEALIPADPVTAAPAATPIVAAPPLGQALAKEFGAPAPTGVHPNDMSSLVFTYWEHTAVKDARRARGLVRPPTDAELMKDLNAPPEDLSVRPPPEERDISLGGIVYVTGDEWTIWLNGKRVTPKALPEEAMDLQVYDEYIELKWYDKYTNQIFPIRLRPHQRFNIDARIFLPG